MPKKKKVFISYSHHDSNFIDTLEQDLKARGIKVWRDVSDIAPGQSMTLEINDAIQKVDHLIIVLSSDSMRSKWVEKELNAALQLENDLRRPNFVIPILIQECQIPPLMKDKLYADFRSDYASGLVVLLKALGRESRLPGGTRSRRIPETPEDAILAWRAAARQAIADKSTQIPTMRPGFHLGNPVGDLQLAGPTTKSTRGVVQFFDRGMVIWHAAGDYAGRAFVVYGEIGHRFKEMGDERWVRLGFPIDDEQNAGWSRYKTNRIEEPGRENRERYSLFENGEIVWYNDGSYRNQCYALWDPIRREYDALGGSNSALGYPTSEPYFFKAGERCDFEGGSVISLKGGRGTCAVYQLLRINYVDSPFNHDWGRYSTPDQDDFPECLAARPMATPGWAKSYLAFNASWQERAVRYPEKRFEQNEYTERYCGITIKSLTPGDRIRFYVNIATNLPGDQYLEFDSALPQRRRFLDKREGVEYWQNPLASELTDGNWHTFVIDLESTTREGLTRSFKWLRGFNFREHIGIADLLVSRNREALESVSINPHIIE